MEISNGKQGFESRKANREQDTEKERKQENQSQASNRNNNKQFFKKVIACVIGIVILFLIATTYRNYVVKEGKVSVLMRQIIREEGLV